MTHVLLTDRAGLTAERRNELAGLVAGQTTLETVVRWSVARGFMVSAVIKQDEYTQDVVVPIGDDLHMVYDST